jgi:hypothetical protein
MRYARDERAKKLVDAHEIGDRLRSRAYSCPSCGAPVHYKRSIGLSPDPIFAHNPHEGSPSCENYYPWQGGFYASPSSETGRAKVAVEDADEEFGLCLEDADTWTVYLRVPEISNDELGSVPLRSLTSAFVEVESAGQRNKLPLIDLRPGVGAARLPVAPVMNPYHITTSGSWPPGVRQQRWESVSRGLSARGTLFRLQHGEWVRLREGSMLELGEELRVVADERNAPPFDCQPLAAKTVSCRGQVWRMWRVTLPGTISGQFERWLQALGIDAVEPAWDVRFASVPDAVVPHGQIPVFATRKSLIARLKASHREEKVDVSLSVNSNRWTESFSLPRESDTAFMSLSIACAGSNELRVAFDDRSAIRFQTREPLALLELKNALALVPKLQLVLDRAVVNAWDEPLHVPVPSQTKERIGITIKPDLEDLRLKLRWATAESEGVEEGLTREMAVRRIGSFLNKRCPAEVTIDGGSLGTVTLVLRVAAKEASASSSKLLRKTRWLGVALERKDTISCPSPTWVLRWARRSQPHLLRAMSKTRDPKWTALIVSAIRKAKG